VHQTTRHGDADGDEGVGDAGTEAAEERLGRDGERAHRQGGATAGQTDGRGTDIRLRRR